MLAAERGSGLGDALWIEVPTDASLRTETQATARCFYSPALQLLAWGRSWRMLSKITCGLERQRGGMLSLQMGESFSFFTVHFLLFSFLYTCATMCIYTCVCPSVRK